MANIRNDFLVEKFFCGIDIREGDQLVAPVSHQVFEVVSIETIETFRETKTGKKVKKIEKRVLAQQVDKPRKEPYVFRVEEGCLHLARWDILRKRSAPCPGPQEDSSLYFGRYESNGKYAVLCQCEENEGPVADSMQESRELAKQEKWKLDEAFFDEEQNLVEHWMCEECIAAAEAKKWGALTAPHSPINNEEIIYQKGKANLTQGAS